MRRSRYPPIESHGVVGNLRTAALVTLDGDVDWLCLPRFDSPSVFGSILDADRGGHFRIAPATDEIRHEQRYWPDTNVLVTRFLHPEGIGELEDSMPVGAEASRDDHLVRRVRVVRGRLPFRLECRPAFDYARAPHAVHVGARGARFHSRQLSLGLAASIPLARDGDAAVADFALGQGESAVFVLRTLHGDGEDPPCLGVGEAEAHFRATVDYWQRWIARCTYRGRWRETVRRSALLLKLLTYEPTGAIIAAPTTSLPEGIGGVRNWDYRFTWIRDASFTVYALLRVGFTDEAIHFMEFLQDRWRRRDAACAGPLHVMYGVDGRTDLEEEELSHLEGYCASRPVRIGNAAHDQLQIDIYGELMDAVYLHNKHAAPIGYDAWTHLRGLVDWVAENWERSDQGVWEARSEPRDYVYSKFMSWVALDRGLRLAAKRALPADHARWLATRDAIYEQVMRCGWNAERNSFVQSYGETALDASALLMPLTFFMAPNDPRMLATIDAIRAPLHRGGLAADGLVYRYDPAHAPDGLPGTEGTFNMCSFWLVEALTRAGRTDPARLVEARLLFEQMLGYGNHLGLYAEQTGTTGEALGNFPQAFTHLSLISAAFNLDRELDRGR
ncbi:MAG: glucoamylase [Proteobacteria bacterium]|nr:MAG: glucoamylase [Pseudomonadota bacterium]